jgi:hypothetical protein
LANIRGSFRHLDGLRRRSRLLFADRLIGCRLLVRGSAGIGDFFVVGLLAIGLRARGWRRLLRLFRWREHSEKKCQHQERQQHERDEAAVQRFFLIFAIRLASRLHCFENGSWSL